MNFDSRIQPSFFAQCLPWTQQQQCQIKQEPSQCAFPLAPVARPRAQIPFKMESTGTAYSCSLQKSVNLDDTIPYIWPPEPLHSIENRSVPPFHNPLSANVPKPIIQLESIACDDDPIVVAMKGAGLDPGTNHSQSAGGTFSSCTSRVPNFGLHWAPKQEIPTCPTEANDERPICLVCNNNLPVSKVQYNGHMRMHLHQMLLGKRPPHPSITKFLLSRPNLPKDRNPLCQGCSRLFVTLHNMCNHLQFHPLSNLDQCFPLWTNHQLFTFGLVSFPSFTSLPQMQNIGFPTIKSESQGSVAGNKWSPVIKTEQPDEETYSVFDCTIEVDVEGLGEYDVSSFSPISPPPFQTIESAGSHSDVEDVVPVCSSQKKPSRKRKRMNL